MIHTPHAAGKVFLPFATHGNDTEHDIPILGVASYYNYRKKDGTLLKDVAWYGPPSLIPTRKPVAYPVICHARFYPHPKQGAEKVADRVAFYIDKQGLKLGSPPIDA